MRGWPVRPFGMGKAGKVPSMERQRKEKQLRHEKTVGELDLGEEFVS